MHNTCAENEEQTFCKNNKNLVYLQCVPRKSDTFEDKDLTEAGNDLFLSRRTYYYKKKSENGV